MCYEAVLIAEACVSDIRYLLYPNALTYIESSRLVLLKNPHYCLQERRSGRKNEVPNVTR